MIFYEVAKYQIPQLCFEVRKFHLIEVLLFNNSLSFFFSKFGRIYLLEHLYFEGKSMVFIKIWWELSPKITQLKIDKSIKVIKSDKIDKDW